MLLQMADSPGDNSDIIRQTFSDAVCKKCFSEPCMCGVPTVRNSVSGTEVCRVCHRSMALCLCMSHHASSRLNPEESEGDPDDLMPRRPLTDKAVDVMVRDAMAFYYNRDADGLARWLRRALP